MAHNPKWLRKAFKRKWGCTLGEMRREANRVKRSLWVSSRKYQKKEGPDGH